MVVMRDGGYYRTVSGEVAVPITESQRVTRTQILEFARKCIEEDRNQKYGAPEDNFKAVAAYWDVFLANRKSGSLRPEEVAQMMVLFKNARLQADPKDLDSWVDMAGYAACGGEAAMPEAELLRVEQTTPKTVDTLME